LIVFADSDNQPSGWVTAFKKFLEAMLEQVSGQTPKVILKNEFDTMTSPRLDNAGVLIAILSKDFIQSPACMEYVEKFHAATQPTAALINRVFKVFKTPVSTSEQPPRLRELFGYEMYQLDLDSGESREFSDYFTTEAERQYWMELIDVSYDIHDTLIFLKEGKSPYEAAKVFQRKTIYLAQTCHDLAVQRNIIHRELQRLGYGVLPAQSLPSNIADLERSVRSDLAAAGVSIHLIGSDYGEIPEGSDRSVQELQHRLASERGLMAKENKEDFPRLIWITPDLTHTGERQKRFIEGLRRDVEASEGAEILQTQLEDFKMILREELEEASEKRMLTENSGQSIYLMHDKVDHEAVKPYIDLIVDSGFNLLMPEFEGELLELRQKHVENLRNLDGAIIFKGKVNEQWVRMKALDLLKAPGFGRKKPIIGKVIVTKDSTLVNKETFKNQNLKVIEGDEESSLNSIKAFLNEFKS
ncbi:MAG TPA: hypothetical protein VK666_23350, partial [Chryseolinea sp.]|nr:hypothetical protein [Chryseolinea sp.]